MTHAAVRSRQTALAVAGLLAVALAAQGSLLSRGFLAVSGDDPIRVLHGWLWLRRGYLPIHGWPPLHHMIVGAGLRVWPDLVWCPVLLHAAFAIAAMLALMGLAQELFGRRAVTLAAGLLAAVHPDRVVLGSVPMAEIPQALCILLGAWALARWLRRRGGTDCLFLACLAWSLAAMLRYETWFFLGWLALLPWWLWWRPAAGLPRPSLRTCLLAGGICAAFPLEHMIESALTLGAPLGFMQGNAIGYRFHVGTGWHGRLTGAVLTQFTIESCLTLNALGLWPLARLARRRAWARCWLAPPALAMATLTGMALMAKALPAHNFWRIAVPWNLLLLPFTAYAVVAGSGLLARRLVRGAARPRIALGLLLAALAVLVHAAMQRTEGHFRDNAFYPPDLEAGRFLEPLAAQSHQPGGGLILIDSHSRPSHNVLVASNHPEAFVMDVGTNPDEPRPSLLSGFFQADPARIRAAGIRWVVLRDHPEQARLAARPGVRMAAQFGYWSIYRLEEPAQPAPGRPLTAAERERLNPSWR